MTRESMLFLINSFGFPKKTANNKSLSSGSGAQVCWLSKPMLLPVTQNCPLDCGLDLEMT